LYQIEQDSRDRKIIKGSLIKIYDAVDSFSPSDYSLKYIFKKATTEPVEFDTSAEGGLHLLELSPAESLTVQTGYNVCTILAVSLTDPTEINPIANLVIEFLPDPNTENDARSFALRVVEKLETAILLLADKTMSSISIDGRSYAYKDLAEMERMRDYYSQKAGIKSDTQGRRRILTKFTNE